MSVEIVLGTPLADALNNVVQPKLVEMEWSTGGLDDSALAEYVILMLVNGKTQDQIALELSNDLLNLEEGDTAASDFSTWLFQQVHSLNQQLNPAAAPQNGQPQSIPSFPDQETQRMSRRGSRQSGHSDDQDAEMADSGGGQETAVPTGPKSMRNSRPQGRGRLVGQLNKAMDRSNESILHRVRPQQGTERINSHSREPPKGPRGNNLSRNSRMMTGRPMGGINMPGVGMAQNAPPSPFVNMNPQQQMQLLAMYEEQARMMAQIFSPPQQPLMPGLPQPAINPAFQAVPPQGGSLFDRVQPNPQQQQQQQQQHRGGAGFKRQNGFQKNRSQNNDRHITPMDSEPTTTEDTAPSSSMEVETSSQKQASSDPGTSVCRFNLHCTNKDCQFAHQSPAAPEGSPVDVSDSCPFGAACKNKHCVASHPSPAQRLAHQTEQECKYQANCTNPKCPFRHPTMPMCRNGADCKVPGCKFTHIKMACKFNPCLNARCPFKHNEGQQRGKFTDKVWTPAMAEARGRDHVSERKFVEDENEEEELIKPGMDVEARDQGANEILSQGSAELVT